ncbi:hypothetical protein D3C81_1057930 [compost metagenome]
MGGKQAEVDEHADADEEQAEENVAERANVGFDLVPIVALAQQHAGEESAQRHGQAQQVGQPGGEQHDHQRQQHEQFGGIGLGYLVKQPRQQPAAGHQQGREQQCGLAQSDRQRPVPGLFGAAGDHRDHGQQQYCNQVLEQQHADGVLPVRGEHFAEAAQFLGDDGGGGQRQSASQQQGGRQRQAGEVEQAGQRQGAGDDLQAAEPEHYPAQGEHARQGKLQAETEQQEHHAELGEQRHVLVLFEPAQAAGAERQANAHVAQQGRQLEAAKQGNDQQRGGQDDQ